MRLLLSLILLSITSCSFNTITPRQRCDLRTIHGSADWWVCVHNQDMLDNHISLSKEIREAHKNRFNGLY